MKELTKFDGTKLPTLAELFEISDVDYWKQDALNSILNMKPKAEWVKVHPFITGHKYIPIGIVEMLLQRIFKHTKIEILREGTSFNGVYVVVRLHVVNPTSGEWEFHDGIGACPLQVKSGSSPADLININPGALSIAYPIAESYAVKDAAEKYGNLFGRNINRKDYIEYEVTRPSSIQQVNDDKEKLRVLEAIKKCKTGLELEKIRDAADKNGFMSQWNNQFDVIANL